MRGPGLEGIPAEQLADFSDAVCESTIPFLVEVLDWAGLPESSQREIEREHVALFGMPPPDWCDTTLAELMEFRNGKLSPKRDDALRYPVFGSNGIIGRSAETNAPAATTVIGRVGSYCGSLHFSEEPCWVTDNAIRATAIGPNDPRFLFSLLKTLRLHSRRHGSGQPLLNQSMLSAIRTRVPPPVEQLAISHVLGTLDDKIELNRRMNDTLEAVEQALFKSWFVDFEPVRAKMGGRDTGLPAELEEAFPTALDSRGSPQGWPETRLTDIASFTRGSSYRSAELSDSRVALLTLKSFERGGGYKSGGLKPYTGAFKPEQVLDAGELVVALTDVTQMAEVIGWPAIVPEDDDYDELVASLDVGILRPLNGDVGTPFLHGLLLTDRYRAHVRAHCTGTTVLHLGKQALPSYCLPLPTPTVLSAFHRIAEPLMIRRRGLQVESRALANLRNVLLPKLTSGELRVPDAERIAAAVI